MLSIELQNFRVCPQQTRKSQKSGDLGFLAEEEESDNKETSIRALRAAHAETFQELEKTRKLLSMESRICGDYKVMWSSVASEISGVYFIFSEFKKCVCGLQAELEAVMEKAKKDRADYEQKLKQQTQLLDARATKIHKLEGMSDPVSSTGPDAPLHLCVQYCDVLKSLSDHLLIYCRVVF